MSAVTQSAPPADTTALINAGATAGKVNNGVDTSLTSEEQLLGGSGVPVPFAAEEAGTASDWLYGTVPTGRRRAFLATSRHRGLVLLAHGKVSVTKPGASTIVVRLTRRGRALLRSAARAHRRVHLISTAAFTPRGLRSITRNARLTLRP
jgi:hypothetical protein